MNLLICVITHNRLDYTKDCLRALNENTGKDLKWRVVVVDNASTDGTQEWLQSDGVYDHAIFNPNNRYPGAACNQGWSKGLRMFDEDENFTHLCRIDNDCKMKPGWFEQVEQAFDSFPDLGQFGLIEMSESNEFPYKEIQSGPGSLNIGPTNIGGPNVITREVWELGVRYTETPWQHFGGPTGQEDVRLSLDIKDLGKIFGNTTTNICVEQSFTDTDKYYDYYCRTFSQRGHGIPTRVKDGVVITPGDGSHI